MNYLRLAPLCSRFRLALLCSPTAAALHAQATLSVGEIVQAGGEYKHGGTVLEIKGDSCRLHYDDGTPDHWEHFYSILSAPYQQGQNAAQSGPRNGKYLILGYVGRTSQYNGYFVLNSGKYELFNPGGRSAGTGSYSFDSASSTVQWKSGPFATQGWNGTQKFEVSREGKTHIIRLMERTIGTNSTD